MTTVILFEVSFMLMILGYHLYDRLIDPYVDTLKSDFFHKESLEFYKQGVKLAPTTRQLHVKDMVWRIKKN